MNMMNENNKANLLTELSDAMAGAVETAAAGTVLVDGRRRFPASGVVYGEDLVLTASHVVERDDDISVLAADERELSARLAGRDPGSDLAVLRLEGSLSARAEPADQTARIGQLVLALGRPTPAGIQASLGVVSAIAGPLYTWHGGMLERHIRTDAIPYPGFSGGPLIDTSGRLVGLNTSGLSRGASLAIPVDLAWKIAAALAEGGSVRRGYLGIRSQPVAIPENRQAALGRKQEAGLLLVGVEKDSPAESGGLLVGDILTGFAGMPVSEPDQLIALLTGDVVDQPTQVEVLRGNELLQITITIGERA
jgi:S1-C subfamily serine protease